MPVRVSQTDVVLVICSAPPRPRAKSHQHSEQQTSYQFPEAQPGSSFSLLSIPDMAVGLNSHVPQHSNDVREACLQLAGAWTPVRP